MQRCVFLCNATSPSRNRAKFSALPVRPVDNTGMCIGPSQSTRPGELADRTAPTQTKPNQTKPMVVSNSPVEELVEAYANVFGLNAESFRPTFREISGNCLNGASPLCFHPLFTSAP